MNKVRNLAICFLVSLVFLQCAARVSAQASLQDNQLPFDLSVTPPSNYLVIHPGNLALHAITIKNQGTMPLEITPQLLDFSTDGKTGQPVLSSSLTFPYLDQDKTSFAPVTLPPGSTAQLKLHFSVPSDAADQEYPMTVLFKATQQNPESVAGTPVTGMVGSNIIVLVSKSGKLEQNLKVQSFQTSRIIDSFAEVRFAPIIKNDTFAATIASGSASITDWRGKKVAHYEILPKVILGYSSRSIEPIKEQTSASATLQTRPENVFWYDNVFLIGPYTITLSLTNHGQDLNSSFEYTYTVWALPFALLIAAVAAAGAMGYFAWKKRQRPYF